MSARAAFSTFAFGPFRFEGVHGLLTRDGAVVPLTPKAAQLLALLLERRGEVVTKDEILTAVWPNTHVTESSLTFHIRMVRRALGDDATGHYIETLQKRGYRFVAPVSIVVEAPAGRAHRAGDDIESEPAVAPPLPLDADAEPDGEEDRAPAPAVVPSRQRRQIAAGVSLIAVSGALLAIVTMVAARSSRWPPAVNAVVQLTHDGTYKNLHLAADNLGVLYYDGDRTNRIRLDTRAIEPVPALAGFLLLDLSRDGEEALALRPHDRGAEDALWIVKMRTGAAQRIGMIRARDAAWSPDGRRIVYTEGRAVHLADRRGIAVATLATTSGSTYKPQWSPDGRTIRFTIVIFSDRRISSRVVEVAATGGEPRDVFWGPADSFCGRWMPTGDFVFLSGGENQMHVALSRERASLFGSRSRDVMALESEDLHFADVVPSRDGRTVFALALTRPRLTRYDRDRHDFAPLWGGVAAMAVDFSRDGNWAVYVALPDHTLWRARSDGTDRRQLTKPPMEVTSAAWSPDGARLALRAQMPPHPAKVYVMPSSGGTPEPLVTADVAQGSPTWSADGKRLAFGDVPEEWGRATGSEAITLYDLESRAVSFVPGSNGMWSSRWSPDGRSLAALTIDPSQSLKVFDFATGAWRPLGVAHMNNPSWSRDSTWIYCDPEGPEHHLRRVRVRDGYVETLADVSRYHVPWAGAGLGEDVIFSRVESNIYAFELAR
jgi:DNA-binding winged helix-turn-helix (wHTH) protein/Tol biopolymer transport system component